MRLINELWSTIAVSRDIHFDMPIHLLLSWRVHLTVTFSVSKNYSLVQQQCRVSSVGIENMDIS
jgi:hypothetical protein